MVLAAVVLSGCSFDDHFVCTSDAQCRRGDMVGTCEASNSCSFPDIDCASGRRYDTLAELSGQCVADDDHDMIADDGDNCPGIANPEQFDEDKDKVGDDCDPCPIASDNNDDDGDGVGNACDPRPMTAGDTIVLFEGFHKPLASTWSVSGSAIVENDGLTLQGARIVTLPMQAMGTETLMAGITMVEPPVMGVWLGIPFDAGVGGAFCELTPTALEVFAEQPAGTPPVQTGTVPFTATINTPYVVSMQRLGMMQFGCSARAASSSTATDVTGMSTLPATTQNIDVGCDAPAKLSWVMLIADN